MNKFAKLDGRRKAPQIPPRLPLALTNGAVRRVIDAFEESGSASHSRWCSTLQYVLNHCEENKIASCLFADPAEGYFIKKLPSAV